MSEVRGRLWVDPEGVSAVGDRYDQHAGHYDQILKHVDHLREKYRPAWGDDQMGDQFKEQFDGTMDAVEGIVRGVRSTLDYTATGLRLGGKDYREADDDAREAGSKINGEFSNLSGKYALTTPREALLRPTEDADDTTTPLLASRREAVLRPTEYAEGTTPLQPRQTLLGKTVNPDDDTLVEGLPLAKTMLTSRTRAEMPLEPMLAGERVEAPLAKTMLAGRTLEEPLLPTESTGHTLLAREDVMRPTEGETTTPLIPAESTPRQFVKSVHAEAEPAMPAISAYRSYPNAVVDGQPVAAGYEVESLTTFPDGTSRLDANYYDSIVPLAGHSVTGADSGGDQLFLVKPKTDMTINAADPGYKPLVISFDAAGNSTPLTT